MINFTKEIRRYFAFAIGRYFIDFRGKHRLLKILDNPFKYKNIYEGDDFQVKYFDTKYSGTYSNFIDWGVFFQEGFEKGLIKFFFNEIRLGKFHYFIDIGANSGSVSLPFAKIIKTICFEPIKYNFDKLKKNYQINNNLKKFRLFNFGLSNVNERKKIFFSDIHSNIGTASIVRFYKKNNKYEEIKLKKLDDILKFKNKSLLIKIDVEGYEDKVMLGMKKLLKYNKVCVYLETQNKNLALFLKRKYKVFYPKFWYSKYFFLKKKSSDDLIFKNYD
jgi:FkbM family methyltransferase